MPSAGPSSPPPHLRSAPQIQCRPQDTSFPRWCARSRDTKDMPVACPTGSVPSQKFEPKAKNFWWRCRWLKKQKRIPSTKSTRNSTPKWYARRDSNPQPSEPESDALSIEPLAHFIDSLCIIPTFFIFVKGCAEKYFLVFRPCSAKTVVFSEYMWYNSEKC